MRMSDAGLDCRIQSDGSFMRANGILKKAATAQYLHKPRQRLRIFSTPRQPPCQPDQRFRSMPQIDLQVGIKVVSAGEIRINHKGALKSRFRYVRNAGLAVEFVQQPVGAPSHAQAGANCGSSAMQNQNKSRAALIESSDRWERSSLPRTKLA